MTCFHYNLNLLHLSLTWWTILDWLKVNGFSTPNPHPPTPPPQLGPPKTTRLCSVPSGVTCRVFCHIQYVLNTYMQTNTHTLSAWESGPLDFLGPHPAFAAALQSSTSFTWEWALVWRKSTQWHFPQCHIYKPPHRAGGTISQSDTVRPQTPWTIINCCPGGR